MQLDNKLAAVLIVVALAVVGYFGFKAAQPAPYVPSPGGGAQPAYPGGSPAAAGGAGYPGGSPAAPATPYPGGAPQPTR